MKDSSLELSSVHFLKPLTLRQRAFNLTALSSSGKIVEKQKHFEFTNVTECGI